VPQSTLFGNWCVKRPPTTTCLPDPLGFIAINLLASGTERVNMIWAPLGDQTGLFASLKGSPFRSGRWSVSFFRLVELG
jgi:hypothetical protein